MLTFMQFSFTNDITYVSTVRIKGKFGVKQGLHCAEFCATMGFKYTLQNETQIATMFAKQNYNKDSTL